MKYSIASSFVRRHVPPSFSSISISGNDDQVYVCGVWSEVFCISLTTCGVTGDQKVKNYLFHFVWSGFGAADFFTTDTLYRT